MSDEFDAAMAKVDEQTEEFRDALAELYATVTAQLKQQRKKKNLRLAGIAALLALAGTVAIVVAVLMTDDSAGAWAQCVAWVGSRNFGRRNPLEACTTMQTLEPVDFMGTWG